MATQKKISSVNKRQEAARPTKASHNRGGQTHRLSSSAFSGGEREVSNPVILKFILGLSLGAFTLYLLFSFGSYLIHGAANQSLFIDTAGAERMVSEIEGGVGVHGSQMMHSIVNGWLGLGFLFIIYLLGFISLWLVVRLRASLVKHVIVSITLALWTALALSMLPEEWTRTWFFLPGGVFGQMMASTLDTTIGKIGIYILLALVLALLIFLTFSGLQERYTRRIKKREESLRMAKESPAAPAARDEELSEEEIHETVPDTPESEEPPITEPTIDTAPIPEEKEEEPYPLPRPEEWEPVQEPLTPDSGVVEEAENGEVTLEVVDNRSMDDEVDADAARLTAEELVSQLGPYDPRKELSHYTFPSLDLLRKYDQESKEIDQEEIQANKELITNTFKSFNIDILSITATVGPAITLYEVVPAAGVHISRIRGLEENIAMSLSALGIRIIAPMPGKGTIGLEVPNKNPQIVSMRSVIASNKFQTTKADLPIALGRTITNEVFVFDLAKAPHLLVAGATGQGKSVGLNAIITSLLYTKHPSELKFVMVDPKMVEFSMYALIEKHYMAKLPGEEQVIITDTKRVAATLNSLCQEMDDRYELLAAAHVRNIKEYNELFVGRRLNPEKGHRYLPYIVLIIDEYGDLLITAGKEIEIPITRLAQKARAIGIHAIIATQRPTAKIITGAIKANFPGRIAFRVTSSMDSRIILDTTGANRLVGKGDLLFQSGSNMTRVQCAFVDTPEVNAIANYISSQRGYTAAYELPEVADEAASSRSSEGSGMALDPNEKDEIFDEVARMLVLEQRASISLIQQKFSIGYNRAARLMNQLVAGGVVTPKEGNKPQEVIPSSIEELDRY